MATETHKGKLELRTFNEQQYWILEETLDDKKVSLYRIKKIREDVEKLLELIETLNFTKLFEGRTIQLVGKVDTTIEPANRLGIPFLVDSFSILK